jgi:hypothetical protein
MLNIKYLSNLNQGLKLNDKFKYCVYTESSPHSKSEFIDNFND